jgi:hypothetical protein
MATASHVKRALEVFGDRLTRMKNVVGIGRVPAEGGGSGEWELAVYVEKKHPESVLAGDDLVPKTLELPGRGKTVRIATQVIEQGPVSLESPGKEPLGKEPL